MNQQEILVAFRAIPAGVTYLDLRSNGLYSKTGAELALIKGSLQHLKTIYLTASEIEAMSKEQRSRLREIFPQIESKNIFLLDDKGNQLPPSREKAALSLLGFGSRELGSLQNICSLFTLTNNIPFHLEKLPEPVLRDLKLF
jgi:hypothetical protein